MENTSNLNYHSGLLLLFSVAFLIAAGLYLLSYLLKKQKLKRIRALSFKPSYRVYLEKTFHYKQLSADEKEKIESSILLFIHTKRFIAVNMDVTDEMRIIIAFYACLLLLHINTENCYDDVKTIIIFSHAVATKQIQSAGGIYTKEEFIIEGEATDDTVVISWHEAKADAYHHRHNNVVIHEFAHEIDLMSGKINGVPPLEKSKYHAWTSSLLKEFNKLNKIALKNRSWGKYELLGSYAVTNEAEFFAVISERYFQSPHSLKKNFPELYAQLRSFYGFNSDRLLYT